MIAVSETLIDTILELQQLPSLLQSTLGGGTNLAIRYHHRKSYDVDLFFPNIIGKQGYEGIKAEVLSFYGGEVFGMDYPCDVDDQFLFQRFFVKKTDLTVKVEILQNMQTHLAPEFIDGIKLMNLKDIGPLKLTSVANRANNKDVYDLDYLTDEISLNELMDLLSERENKYHLPEQQNIFDQDEEISPTKHPELLLKFEELKKGSSLRPGHSNPRIDFIGGEKNWALARSSWRRKVRAYFRSIDKDFPGVKGISS
jgi:hypothetical protein